MWGTSDNETKIRWVGPGDAGCKAFYYSEMTQWYGCDTIIKGFLWLAQLITKQNWIPIKHSGNKLFLLEQAESLIWTDISYLLYL